MSQTIVLVESQPDIREITGSLLQNAGYHVITEESPVKALRLIHGEKVDLVITEIKLLEMGGNQFIKELSRLPKPPPVLVLTMDLRGIAASPPIKAVLQKPFTYSQLRQFISRALSHI